MEKIDPASGVSVVTHVVILTDGEDTSSKTSLEQTRTLLGKINSLRNYKVTLVGVGLGAKEARSLAYLGSIGDRDIEFRNLSKDSDIQDLFEHFSLQLKVERTQLLVIQSPDSSSVPSGRSSYSPSPPAISYSPSPTSTPYSPSPSYSTSSAEDDNINTPLFPPSPRRSDEVNHGCHLCLCCFSCGVWLPVWLCACCGVCCKQPCGFAPPEID